MGHGPGSDCGVPRWFGGGGGFETSRLPEGCPPAGTETYCLTCTTEAAGRLVGLGEGRGVRLAFGLWLRTGWLEGAYRLGGAAGDSPPGFVIYLDLGFWVGRHRPTGKRRFSERKINNRRRALALVGGKPQRSWINSWPSSIWRMTGETSVGQISSRGLKVRRSAPASVWECASG